MIFGYLRKTLWRNKTRSFFLTVGIIVSIMLVTGVNISSNAMQYKIEISVNVNKMRNYNKLCNKSYCVSE